jgi:hypothetical protein
MKRLTILTAALVAVISGLPAADAAVILSDNFDGYANQAAYEAAWPAIGTTADVSKKSAQLSSAQSVSAPNSVHVPVSTTATASLTEYRNRRSFAESGTLAIGDQLVWSFDFYDSITGNPQRNYSNMQDTTAPGAANQLISMGLNNNQGATDSGGNYYMARILSFAHTAVDPDGGPSEAPTGITAGAYFKLNDPGAPLRSIGWHNLKAILSTDDGLSTDFRFFVDNTLAETVLNVGTAAQIRSYDNIVLGSGLTNGGAVAYFDNVNLEFIPGVPPNVAPVVNPEAPEVGITTAGDIITTVFTATDVTALPVTFSNAVLASFVPLIPSATNPAFNGTVDSAGNFTWDTTGFARGVYTINVTATDSGTPPLSGTGGAFVVTIEQVPEPTTIVMVGLAVAGLFGVRRRVA